MTVSAIRSEEKLTPTSQYLSLNFFLLFFWVLAWFDVGLGIVLQISGQPVIGIYFIVCGAVYLLAHRRQRQRRYRVAPFLRPVRGLNISLSLLYANWHNFRLANLAFAGLTACLVPHEYGSIASVALVVICMRLTLPAPAGALALVKYHFDKDFRIVVFRRNVSAIALAHKSVIMPACGLFGQVLLIVDQSLSAYREPRNDRLSQWWLSEMYFPMVTCDGQEHWRQVVMIELTYADFVVLDWSGEVTANMRWELKQALLACPPHRILLILESQDDLALPENAQIIGATTGLITAPNPSDGMRKLFFLHQLGSAMAALRPERRSNQMLARARCLAGATDLSDIDWKSFEECSMTMSGGSDEVRQV